MDTKLLERSIIHGMVFGDPVHQDLIFSRCDPMYFVTPEARKAFLTGLKLYNDGKDIDLTAIHSRSDEKTGAYIIETTTELGRYVVFDNIRQALDDLEKSKQQRDFIEAAEKAITAAKAGDDAAMLQLSSRIEEIQSIGSGSDLVPLSDSVASAIAKLGEYAKPAIKTGFRIFDDYFDGIRPGRLALLAAGTGIGKSAFATNLAWNVANHGGVVLYLSLEMSHEAISTRIISNLSKISKPNIQKAIKENDAKVLDEVMQAADEIKERKIIYKPKSVINARIVVNSIRQIRAQYGRCDLVIVDYLQLMQPIKRSDSREREVADFSRSLVTIALSEDTFILALSQVNRQVESRSSNKLRLSDIRESAAPTQDASGVFALYVRDDEDETKDIIRMQLALIKNREDRTGVSTVIFNKPLQSFMDEIPTF